MIVTFQTDPTGTADSTSMYLNMLRCITAIVTAPAGTSNIVVNPYTATNTINTTANCIVRIDCNTEAGGWNISTSHTVPSTYRWPAANNTSQAFTAMASQTTHQYVADFYNASSKAANPYKKISFHSWTTVTSMYSPMIQSSTPVVPYLSAMTARGAYSHLLVTYGSSSTPDWTDTAYQPGGGVVLQTTTTYNNSNQTKSQTFNGYSYIYSAGNQYPPTGLWWDKANVYYTVAATADYIIIWEYLNTMTYDASTLGTSTNTPYIAANHGSSYGSIYYFGIRETQPWENMYSNNVPWVAWSHIPTNTNTGTAASPFAQDHIAANMMTLSQTFALKETTPKIYSVYNTNTTHNVFGVTTPYNTAAAELQNNLAPGYYTGQANGYLDVPIFLSAGFGGPTTFSTYWNLQLGNYVPNPPVIDSVTGTWTMPAYPIIIKKGYAARWNQGGACRGIYKSLTTSGFAQLKNYWKYAGQLFVINGEFYMPIFYYRDAWLVRWA